MLKKFLCLILCLFLTLSLTACSFKINWTNTILESILDNDLFNDNNDTVIVSPSVKLPDDPKTQHNAISGEKYYQYSLLNDTEKQIYQKICKSIETQQNFINVKQYNLTFEELENLFDKVTADNPQYFWLTKFIQYSFYTKKGKTEITHLVLHYTDGETTDEFNEKNEFISTADREEIKSQKITLDNIAADFLESVPTDLTDIEKERLIHDFVLETIVYADAELAKPLERDNYLRIYDIYGALVEKYAVCEGYVKLFQYLCYKMGINSTMVTGKSEGENHAWNTIQLENEWYHVDTTWDDGSTDGIPLYKYFNLTTEQINTDHIIDTSSCAVPNATSQKFSFKNTYGITVNPRSKPQDFQTAIDYVLKYDSKYLVLVCENGIPNYDYFRKYFFNYNSDIQKYAKTKGSIIHFKTSYYEIENFIHLEIN